MSLPLRVAWGYSSLVSFFIEADQERAFFKSPISRTKDGISRASQVDVVPKIGPGETVVRGVEFKHLGR